MSDPFSPADLTTDEQNALALADAELQMLTELVEMRRQKGLTQEDVANALGRDKSSVSRFERLDSDPRLSSIRRYARAIGAMVTHDVFDFSQRQPIRGQTEPVAVEGARFEGMADVFSLIERYDNVVAFRARGRVSESQLVAVGR